MHALRVDGFELGVKPESRGYRFVETRVVAKIPRVHKPFAPLRAKPVEVVHDNNGTEDSHLWPFHSPGGTINWSETMGLLRSLPQQYPLLLELRDYPEFPLPQSLELVKQIFEKLETV